MADAWREQHGWFGEPWPSGVCYADDGRLRTWARKDFPHGESCSWCGVVLSEEAGDGGTAMPYASETGGLVITHVHKECLTRQVCGGPGHLQGRCSCHGGPPQAGEAAGRRAEALAVWDWLGRRGQ